MSNKLVDAASEFLSRDTFNKGDHLEENMRGLALIQDPALAQRMADRKKALKALGFKSKNQDQKMEDVKLTNTSIKEGVEIKPSEFHAFRKGEKTVEQIASEKKKPVGVVRGELNLHADHWSRGENHYNKLFKVERQTNEEVEQIDELKISTLTRYGTKATQSLGRDPSKTDKRIVGINRARSKVQKQASMKKEEVEELDEAQYGVNLGSRPASIPFDKVKVVKTFLATREKEAREFAKQHGHKVVKHKYPEGHTNKHPHEFQVVKEEVEELDEEKLSNWSFNDLHAHLKKNGWERDRNSKHIQYVHPVTKKTIAVPHKHGKTVAPGTVRNILQRMSEEYSDYGRALAKLRGRLKEEIEELEELKKSTLKSYVSKAAFDATQQSQQSMQRGKSDTETSKHVGKAVKRLAGIRSALRRM